MSLTEERAATVADVRAARRPSGDTDATYTIGELARDYGVTLRTLRFYEDRRLLNPRRNGSARLYSARDRARLETILRGKQLGFTLTEIQSMIAAEEGGASAPRLVLSPEQIEAQIAHLKKQRTEIDEAIKELEKARRAAA